MRVRRGGRTRARSVDRLPAPERCFPAKGRPTIPLSDARIINRHGSLRAKGSEMSDTEIRRACAELATQIASGRERWPSPALSIAGRSAPRRKPRSRAKVRKPPFCRRCRVRENTGAGFRGLCCRDRKTRTLRCGSSDRGPLDTCCCPASSSRCLIDRPLPPSVCGSAGSAVAHPFPESGNLPPITHAQPDEVTGDTPPRHEAYDGERRRKPRSARGRMGALGRCLSENREEPISSAEREQTGPARRRGDQGRYGTHAYSRVPVGCRSTIYLVSHYSAGNRRG